MIEPKDQMKIIVLLFLSMLSFFSIEPSNAQASATSLIEKAKTQAQEENKAIFIKFEATWCGFCHQMTKNMKAETTKQFFEDNFVVVPLVVFEVPSKKNLENPGAQDLLREYKAEMAGLPFWIILDANGKELTSSFYGRQNIGGPTTLDEVRIFIRKLRKAVPKVSKEDEEAILEQFVK